MYTFNNKLKLNEQNKSEDSSQAHVTPCSFSVFISKGLSDPSSWSSSCWEKCSGSMFEMQSVLRPVSNGKMFVKSRNAEEDQAQSGSVDEHLHNM